MTFQEFYNDTRQRQREMKLAGLYSGKIDGIAGPKTVAGWAQWMELAKRARDTFGELDERSERNLATVLPELQRSIREWFSKRVLPWAAKRGLAVRVIAGTRSFAEQDELYAQGRTKPGKKVTNARGGFSNHNFGTAIDLGIFEGGKYAADDVLYRSLFAACGCPQGCLWGGNWKSMPDSPHYQLAKWGDSTAALRDTLSK